jgi:2-deoxy-D-gluconate 3-dehydrogenase
MILNNFSLEGKTALVTGASSGIGQAIAIALAEAGADVASHSRSAGNSVETVAAIGAAGKRGIEVVGDMADRETPDKIFADAGRAIWTNRYFDK